MIGGMAKERAAGDLLADLRAEMWRRIDAGTLSIRRAIQVNNHLTFLACWNFLKTGLDMTAAMNELLRRSEENPIRDRH